MIDDFFDASAATVAGHLDAGRTVAVLSEGDPLFYGSYMHLHVRLSRRYPTEVIPGVTSLSGCWSAAGMPIAQGDDVLSVVPGTLPRPSLARRLGGADAAVVIKVGRNLAKVRRALAGAGRDRRRDLCRARHDARRRGHAARREGGRRRALFRRGARSRLGRPAMSGRLCVVGLGPGEPRFLTHEARGGARRGRGPLRLRPLSRPRSRYARGQRRHASDNREEMARAGAALADAAAGASVALVSGGDPGVFAMAAAVCEAIDKGPAAWRAIDLAIVPGITAMLAVAARVGAPLGHDFCAISLSDNLKPWPLIERRLAAAAEAGFVIALYNPVSKARPRQLARPSTSFAAICRAETPVIFGRAVGRADESVEVARLAAADPTAADMATLIIVGSAETRVVERPGQPPLVYTPRAAGGARGDRARRRRPRRARQRASRQATAGAA